METKRVHFFNYSRFVVLLMSIMSFCLSCNGLGSKDGKDISRDGSTPIYLNPGDNRDTVRLSDIVENVSLVKLESSTGCAIGKIDQVLYDDNSFFCFDSSIKQILRFSLDGKFLNRIGNVGRGRGEYFNPGFISLNRKTKEVWVLDNTNYFDKYKYDGGFIGMMEYDISAKQMVFLDKGLCFFTSDNCNYKPNTDSKDYYGAQLTISDNQSSYNRNSFKRYISVSKELYPAGEGHMTIIEPTPFSENDTTVTFHYSVSYDIYEINKKSGEVRSKYYVDFGKASCKEDLLSMQVMDIFSYLRNHRNEAGLVNNVIETKDLLFFSYVYNAEGEIYLRNKSKVFSGPYVDDLFDKVYSFSGAIDSRTLFYVVNNPVKLKYHPIVRNYLSSEQIEQIDKATIDDNPFILLFRMRE